jgi:sugar phosphate isomerase/epimerase
MDVRYAVSVPEFLEYLRAVGLDHVELKREYLAGHPDTPSAAELGELAERYEMSVTLHAPFRDWNLGSFDDRVRRHAVDRVKTTLDDAVTAGAGAVVVHGGSVPERYPPWIREAAAENARRSITEVAEYAAEVGVPLCLENQPPSDGTRRYTTTPAALESHLAAADVGPEWLGVTLDVGHAAVAGHHWLDFVDRFGDRIRVCHLHDNDGSADDHEPRPDYASVLSRVPADYAVFEMKSVADVSRSLGVDHESVTPEPALLDGR